MKTELLHPFPSVTDGENKSYGGSQKKFKSGILQKAGCGLVSCADVLLYLGLYSADRPVGLAAGISVHGGEIEKADYCRFAERLCRGYFPIMPRLGTNGLFLAAGLNAYFRRYSMPFKAAVNLSGDDLWRRMAEMLENDIPVTMSIGPNFPALWGRRELDFYRKLPAGNYRQATKTSAHFVTATGLDDRRIRISSWGREYYIDRGEYERYADIYSSFLVSNIIYIRRRG